MNKIKLAVSLGIMSMFFLPIWVMADETACVNETTAVATTTFKTLAWNLHGEAFKSKIYPNQDWSKPDQSVAAIVNIINGEKPNLVVFDAVHTKFEKKLVTEMAKIGYGYSYVNSSLPKTFKDFKKAIFSKQNFLEAKTYTANFKQVSSGENYAANNSVLEVKMDILGSTYSFFAGGVTPGRNQLTQNNNYFSKNVYLPLINANKPHFILGDFNMYLDHPNMTWYNSVYIAKENFPSASFYVNNYKDVCVVYPGAGCSDSVQPVDGSGRIDHIIFRDYTDKSTIKVVKSYIRQDTENSFEISDHFPIVAEFLITGKKTIPGYCPISNVVNVIASTTAATTTAATTSPTSTASTTLATTTASTTVVTVTASTTTATTTATVTPSIIVSTPVNTVIAGPQDCTASWPSRAYPKEGKFSFTGVHNLNYMAYRLGGNDVKDSRFVCYDKKFYDCGWERKDSSVSKRAKNGAIVGSWKCDLKNKKWDPVVRSSDVVSSATSSPSGLTSTTGYFLFPLNILGDGNSLSGQTVSTVSGNKFNLLGFYKIPGKTISVDSSHTFTLEKPVDIKSLSVSWTDNKSDCQAQVSSLNTNSGWKDVSSPGSLSLSNIGKTDKISISVKNAGQKCGGVTVSSINISGYPF